MKALALLLLLGGGAAHAQGYSYPPPTGCIALSGLICPAEGRVLNVAVTVPSIAPNSDVVVTVNVPGILPGDNSQITLASGSATPPTSIIVGAVFCTTAGVLSIKYGNLAGGLTTNSTATAVTLNVQFSR